MLEDASPEDVQLRGGFRVHGCFLLAVVEQRRPPHVLLSEHLRQSIDPGFFTRSTFAVLDSFLGFFLALLLEPSSCQDCGDCAKERLRTCPGVQPAISQTSGITQDPTPSPHANEKVTSL